MQCALCQVEQVQDAFCFQQHLLKIHSISLLKYHLLLQPGWDFLELTLYKCQMCDEHIGLSKNKFSEHLKDTHHITETAYISKHKTLWYAREEQECVLCGQVYSSKVSFSRHITKDHSMPRRDYRFLLWSTLINPNCQILESTAGSSKVSEIPPFFNGCVYSCKICKNVVNASQTLYDHVQDEHDIPKEAYQQQYGSSIVKYSSYQCLVCESPVSHDREDIEVHLQNQHNLSLNEYFISNENAIRQTMINRKVKKIRIKDNNNGEQKKTKTPLGQAKKKKLKPNPTKCPKRSQNQSKKSKSKTLNPTKLPLEKLKLKTKLKDVISATSN